MGRQLERDGGKALMLGPETRPGWGLPACRLQGRGGGGLGWPPALGTWQSPLEDKQGSGAGIHSRAVPEAGSQGGGQGCSPRSLLPLG